MNVGHTSSMYQAMPTRLLAIAAADSGCMLYVKQLSSARTMPK